MTYRNIIILSAAVAAGPVVAGERLSGDEIRDLLTGKTVHGEHHKLGNVKTHFSADGQVSSRSSNGTNRSGKWWVEDGKRCIQWDHKSKYGCHYIERNDDGTHTLVHGKKGKKLVQMTSVTEGESVE